MVSKRILIGWGNAALVATLHTKRNAQSTQAKVWKVLKVLKIQAHKIKMVENYLTFCINIFTENYEVLEEIINITNETT